MTKQWEYYNCIMISPSQDIHAHNLKMDDLGRAGWELAGVGGQDNEGYRMFFKRPKKLPTIKDILPPE
jgi:hypothetical protein